MACSSATTCPAVTLALPLQAQQWGTHSQVPWSASAALAWLMEALEEEERLSRGPEQTHPWPIIGQRPDRWQGAPEVWVFWGTHVSSNSVGFTSWTVLSPGFRPGLIGT